MKSSQCSRTFPTLDGWRVQMLITTKVRWVQSAFYLTNISRLAFVRFIEKAKLGKSTTSSRTRFLLIVVFAPNQNWFQSDESKNKHGVMERTSGPSLNVEADLTVNQLKVNNG